MGGFEGPDKSVALSKNINRIDTGVVFMFSTSVAGNAYAQTGEGSGICNVMRISECDVCNGKFCHLPSKWPLPLSLPGLCVS